MGPKFLKNTLLLMKGVLSQMEFEESILTKNYICFDSILRTLLLVSDIDQGFIA